MSVTEPKKLLKTSIIYAASQVASILANFLLLPVYTNRLGAVEYGKISTIVAFSGFIGAFLILSIYSGLCRYYKDVEDKNKLVNSAINFGYLMSGAVVLILLLVGKPLAKIAFNFDDGYKILWLVVITMIFSQITDIYLDKYGMEYKALRVSYLTVGRLLIQFMIIIYLVVYQDMGIMGILYGQLTAAVIVYLYILRSEIGNYRLDISKPMLMKMLVFSAGLLPVNIAGWILTVSDRYFINQFIGFEQTGIYSLGYQFGMLINSLFVVPFIGSFTAYKFEIYKDADAKEKFKKLFRSYTLLGCFIMLGISIFSKAAIAILTNQDFMPAYKIVPLVAYSYFLYGMVGYYALGFQIKNQTYKLGLFMLVFAGLNILLNFIFVPWLGIIGAAITTIISYFLLNVTLMVASKDKYKLDLDIRFQAFVQIITVALYILYYFATLHIGNIAAEITISMLTIVAFVFVLLISGLLDKNELIGYMQTLMRKISEKVRMNNDY